MQSKKLLLSESKKITFNQWAKKVKFGAKCDRLKYETFINNYEDAKYIRETNPVQKESNNTNPSNRSKPIDNFISHLVQYF